ncbi:UNVERIFIED_CONTAM: hypothetical protein K2H54_067527 [Gekko kuhli]
MAVVRQGRTKKRGFYCQDLVGATEPLSGSSQDHDPGSGFAPDEMPQERVGGGIAAGNKLLSLDTVTDSFIPLLFCFYTCFVCGRHRGYTGFYNVPLLICLAASVVVFWA